MYCSNISIPDKKLYASQILHPYFLIADAPCKLGYEF